MRESDEGGEGWLGVCGNGYMVGKKEKRGVNRNSCDLQDSDGLLLARLAAAVEVGKAMRQVRGQAGDRVVCGAQASGWLDGDGAGAGRGQLRERPRRVHVAAAMGRRLPPLQLQRGQEGPRITRQSGRLRSSVVHGHRRAWGLARASLGAHLLDTDDSQLGAPRSGGERREGEEE